MIDCYIHMRKRTVCRGRQVVAGGLIIPDETLGFICNCRVEGSRLPSLVPYESPLDLAIAGWLIIDIVMDQTLDCMLPGRINKVAVFATCSPSAISSQMLIWPPSPGVLKFARPVDDVVAVVVQLVVKRTQKLVHVDCCRQSLFIHQACNTCNYKDNQRICLLAVIIASFFSHGL